MHKLESQHLDGRIIVHSNKRRLLQKLINISQFLWIVSSECIIAAHINTRLLDLTLLTSKTCISKARDGGRCIPWQGNLAR